MFNLINPDKSNFIIFYKQNIKMEMEDIKTSATDPIKGDYRRMALKSDHAKRPLWVCADNHIFLEPTSRSLFELATEFLIAIAEPVSRPHYIHEYVLTRFSLYAAASIGQDRGLDRDTIIKTLDMFAKNAAIPPEVLDFIRQSTAQYGRAKLVIKNGKYYLETNDKKTLSQLIAGVPILKAERDRYLVKKEVEEAEDIKRKPQQQHPESKSAPMVLDGVQGMYYLMEEPDAELEEEKAKGEQFEVQEQNVEEVKKQCLSIKMPLIEEYEFKNDTLLPALKLDLKPLAQVRPYQERSLSKMLSSGRARSGIIVLPCGAGKTLVGISAICTVKKSAIIFCNSAVAVDQWMGQIKKWTNAEQQDIRIARFTSKAAGKDELPKEGKAGIIIATYSMMIHRGTRSKEAEQMLSVMKKREWGLLIADEVQVVPAKAFRSIMSSCKAHSKLGLTATLVREDDRIDDLGYLIGPKLYEANWQQLQSQGYIAKVQCLEVWCQMVPKFFMEYLNSTGPKRSVLYVANPNKYIACQYLIEKHEKRGDKIIVFSDNLFVLMRYCQRLRKPCIYGQTSNEDRSQEFNRFENSTTAYTLFLSKVGDTAIDLPSANVIIQISSHYGSRRQEAQRLGRILRPKQNSKGEYNAYFYSLISKNTKEMFHAHKRQQFLVDQGYAFKIIKDIDKEYKEDVDFVKGCDMYREDQQAEFLSEIIKANPEELKREKIEEDDKLENMMLDGPEI